MPGIPTSHQLSFVAETTWSPKWGEFTPKCPKGVIRGPNSPKNGSKMFKLQNGPISAVGRKVS
jgi:hypothetical protein